jgi:DUF1680 family protein
MKTISHVFYFSLILIGMLGCVRQKSEYSILTQPEIDQIRITGGPWLKAMEQDRAWLRSLDPDRLLHHFRKVAGLDTTAREYGGWEMEWRELRGHSIGHYLSAAARMQKLTGDTVLLEKCRYIIRELARCQAAIGTGYVSAFPDEYLERVEAVKPVWAPYYTLHKILAGLTDGYLYLDDTASLKTALNLTHYLYKRIIPLGREHFQKVLESTEEGGMKDVFWELYTLSGDTTCRALALAFHQDSYFIPMLQKEDKLAGQHSNSLIPNIVGIAREYEVTGDVSRRQIAEWFWNQMVGHRTYVTGGTSNGEHWNSAPGHLETELGPASHETCCTYNLIKLSGHIWSWDPDVKYQDYMERALLNGILAARNCETGMPMYYVSMAPGYYKTWSTPDSSFWCCTGTGMENYARIAEYLYAVNQNRLYVNQFVPSELVYPDLGLTLIQQTSLPKGNEFSFTIKCGKPVGLKLAVRIPAWTGAGYQVRINGRELETRPAPGSYLFVDRTWKNGEQLTITFAPHLWYSLLPVKNDHVAIGYGPMVLAAQLDSLAVDPKLRHRYGPYDGLPVGAPVLSFSTNGFEQFIQQPDPGKPVFRMKDLKGNSITFKPFFEILMEQYGVYLPIAQDATRSEAKVVDPAVHGG